MNRALLRWAERVGYQVGWAPAAVLSVVRQDIERQLVSGAIDAVFARENLGFRFPEDAERDVGWRVVVVLMPRPAHLVGFVVSGRRVEAVVPPTYLRYRETFGDVRRELESRVWNGSKVATLAVPLKLLAARMGLVRYGRNNVAYSAVAGSYMQILGYLTDATLPVPASWQPSEPALLPQCERCRACETGCPTEAIRRSQVPLVVERCLTIVNEKPGPWPPWVPSSAHRCLIGCLRCQQVCPANGDLEAVPSGVEFTEEETRELLDADDGQARYSDQLLSKLESIVGPQEARVIGRNLGALLANGASGSAARLHGRRHSQTRQAE
jgi:epoxyqueuosine reductase